MATKLKNLRMTSVDLVRNGANQAADICLYKSADPTEDPTMPTAEETNVLKRFFARLFATPVDAEYEPVAPIEKADDQPEDTVDIYKSAITESLQSIIADETLTAAEKNDMIAKSIGQYHEAMVALLDVSKAADEDDDLDDWEWDGEEEEVEKFNPNHDSQGRFASGGGGATIAGTGGRVNTSGKPAFASTKPKFDGNGNAKITVTRGTMGKDWTEQKLTINSGMKRKTEDSVEYEGMDKAGNSYKVKYRLGADGKADFSRCDVIEKSADFDEIEEV